MPRLTLFLNFATIVAIAFFPPSAPCRLGLWSPWPTPRLDVHQSRSTSGGSTPPTLSATSLVTRLGNLPERSPVPLSSAPRFLGSSMRSAKPSSPRSSSPPRPASSTSRKMPLQWFWLRTVGGARLIMMERRSHQAHNLPFLCAAIDIITAVHPLQILPNGTPWIPNLVEAITNVIAGGGQSITVDQKLIEGPNPNSRGKIFIPLILGIQYLLVKQVQRAIREDIRNESTPLWVLRDIVLTD